MRRFLGVTAWLNITFEKFHKLAKLYLIHHENWAAAGHASYLKWESKRTALDACLAGAPWGPDLRYQVSEHARNLRHPWKPGRANPLLVNRMNPQMVWESRVQGFSRIETVNVNLTEPWWTVAAPQGVGPKLIEVLRDLDVWISQIVDDMGLTTLQRLVTFAKSVGSGFVVRPVQTIQLRHGVTSFRFQLTDPKKWGKVWFRMGEPGKRQFLLRCVLGVRIVSVRDTDNDILLLFGEYFKLNVNQRTQTEGTCMFHTDGDFSCADWFDRREGSCGFHWVPGYMLIERVQVTHACVDPPGVKNDHRAKWNWNDDQLQLQKFNSDGLLCCGKVSKCRHKLLPVSCASCSAAWLHDPKSIKITNHHYCNEKATNQAGQYWVLGAAEGFAPGIDTNVKPSSPYTSVFTQEEWVIPTVGSVTEIKEDN